MTSRLRTALALCAALVAAPTFANTATFTVANGCLIAPLQNVSWSGYMNDLMTSEDTVSSFGNWPNPVNAMRFPFTIRCPNGVAYRFSFSSANGGSNSGTGSVNGFTDMRVMRHSTHPTAVIPYNLMAVTASTGTTLLTGSRASSHLPHSATPSYTARTGNGADQIYFIQPIFTRRNALPVNPLPAGNYTDTLTLRLIF